MNYPLTLTFKTIAFSNQGSVTDATGAVIAYVKQKAFKLKEAITVFEDLAQTKTICTIKTNKIIDFSPQYFFNNLEGQPFGSVKRFGARSIWRANYTIMDEAGGDLLTIREEKAWVKVVDRLVSQIPIVGIFSGFMFHPSYLVTRPDGTQVARIRKQAALFEGKFAIEKLTEITEAEEMNFLLGCFVAILLERYRG